MCGIRACRPRVVGLRTVRENDGDRSGAATHVGCSRETISTRTMMPLSDEEQKILKEIEAQLGATASAATTTTSCVGYTAAQAAKLAGCSVSQLRYWSRSQLVTPAAEGGGYSFCDLVALRVVRSLLDAGLSSTRVRAALRWVRE